MSLKNILGFWFMKFLEIDVNLSLVEMELKSLCPWLTGLRSGES